MSAKFIIRDGTTNGAIENAAINLSFTANGISSGIVNTDFNGEGLVPINNNGEYMVKVSAENYIDFEKNFTIDCSLSQCDLCNKIVPISLSPPIQQGEARVIMNWAQIPKDLDLHILQVNSTSKDECRVNYSNKNCSAGFFLNEHKWWTVYIF